MPFAGAKAPALATATSYGQVIEYIAGQFRAGGPNRALCNDGSETNSESGAHSFCC